MNRWPRRGYHSCSFIMMALVATFIFMHPAIGRAAIECSGCHGNKEPADIRPLDDPSGERNTLTGAFRGSHRKHLPQTASSSNCEKCHSGSSAYRSDHRNGVISLNAKVNDSPRRTVYDTLSSSGASIFFPQTPEPVPAACNGVNCHFENLTKTWGDHNPADACGSCHGAPPTDGAHGKKHGEYYGNNTGSCIKCHPDHQNDLNPITHPLESGARPLAVGFNTSPNNGGNYNSNINYPNYLPSQHPTRNGSCSNIYCHDDGQGHGPNIPLTWSSTKTTTCFSCHKGKTEDNTSFNCYSSGGTWNSDKQICSPYLNMTSNGHGKLVGPQWIRKYACYYCHNNTVNTAGVISDKTMHVNGAKDIKMAPEWNIVGKDDASYEQSTKKCYNVYCHSDGSVNPASVRPFAWTEPSAKCNTCHGHPLGSCSDTSCHDGRTDGTGKIWTLPSKFLKPGTTNEYQWPTGEEWKSAIPMFLNAGAGKTRANSHTRHIETNFSCDLCHYLTIRQADNSCNATGCHPHTTGSMNEVAHLNGNKHVNRILDVAFKNGGSYNKDTKTCSGTSCHINMGTDPVWGDTVNGTIICLGCHGTTNADNDDYGAIFNGTQAKINLSEWATTGHGRYSTSGRYPASGNPAANFPGNPCWYCHDNKVFHNYSSNPFRLRIHNQFEQRFEKECVYCHMEWTADASECIGCHVNQTESLAPQATGSGILFKLANGSTENRYPGHKYTVNCINGVDGTITCHTSDTELFTTGAHKGHNSNAGTWTKAQKDDIKNQYVMMGVCLKCHDDDSGDKCVSCHTSSDPFKYSLGFNPGTGWIKPKKARATSAHFGYKHYKALQENGVTKGGKFCWDCHDPHGDKNIYMIQSMVATTTDGKFGKPITRAPVTFTRKQSGLDYARISAPFDGICNVCHSAGSQHFRSDGGDGHNSSRVCTVCHEHRFSDSHGNKQSCTTCHFNKPVPRHSGFGLPRDCTKCHAGAIGMRMDVMSQLKANSHHVQGVDVSNKHCYACHWESTPEGLIDVQHHEGYNYKNHSTVKNAKVDLVVWGARFRPSVYKNSSTAIQFLASKVSFPILSTSRKEVAKLNTHCISCHSDQNNDTQPFGDCRTPREYAWDKKSIDARYSQTGTARWSQYNTTGKYGVNKAFSAHGNATANAGGWSATTGTDSSIINSRNGSYSVTCFDCHSSHGSKVTGNTTSYETFNGTKNGGNLKETQAGKGGYTMSYKASANENPAAINPYSAGAGQCFDCHLSQNAGTTPWGYQATFGATAAIMGYKDTPKFGQGTKGSTARFPERATKATIVGGHMKASSTLATTPADTIGGTCAACHDPHGVSPSLGADQAYAVPLLKGTWMTSPYKEDSPPPNPSGASSTALSWGQYSWYPSITPITNHNIDRNTFGVGGKISEDDSKFAGLCLQCHVKSSLTNGTNKDQGWKSIDRIHESVKGWGANTEHNYTCSKCHQPHNSGLPRLMQTNCLDYQHRGNRPSGGTPWKASSQYAYAGSHGQYRGYPNGNLLGNFASYEAGVACHTSGTWPNKNYWNLKTPWPTVP
ncbi:geobacter CxxxxCH...CXXCH motif protein [Geobacter sp. OR-1]|uniref:CxxxxCH/CxxCH domain c-type cytochrome n=1 Tax=Geobacter sp. OR-1 TaxID=1266765 RepID=UPI0005430E70|nr:CxxxxCH/CxxCH domain-containing protein [Geobacter sp. OR-1]GAM09450.1 geobacter CxxxxCH...CXXCH motif protein [Geobacter sp. OR-1]